MAEEKEMIQVISFVEDNRQYRIPNTMIIYIEKAPTNHRVANIAEVVACQTVFLFKASLLCEFNKSL